MSTRVVVALAPVEPDAAAAPLAAQRSAARAALASAAEALGVGVPALATDARGAPLPDRGLAWSLAHAPRLAVAALARAGALGVDVEDFTRPRVQRLVRAFDAEERALLDGDDALSLARLWTAKEAVLKLAGVGLAELSGCRLRARDRPGRLVVEHRGLRIAVEHLVLPAHVVALACASECTVEWLARACAPLP